MFELAGSGVGTGIAIGTAYVMERSAGEFQMRQISLKQVDEEIAKLDAALQNALESLKSSRDEIRDDAPHEITAFVDAHMLMVDDPYLRAQTCEIISTQLLGAESALLEHRNQLIEVFDAMDDEYLSSKKYDVDQVIQQIYREIVSLHDKRTAQIEGNLQGKILVAHDLTPADTVLLMNTKMGAFATDLGSPISHVAILARSLQIPAVVGLHESVRYIEHGATIAVDSLDGKVIVEPDEEKLKELRERQRKYQQHREHLLVLRHLPSKTLDGKDISLLANVELPNEIAVAQNCGATGVGLYRTEYLFMNRDTMPDEAEQYESYSEVIKSLGQVTIRTLDLGADKQVDGGREQGKVAVNPALGVRAVRFCLRSPEIFRTQLRAIFRAAVHGDVQCMIPMLSSLDEFQQVVDVINEVKTQLAKENTRFESQVPIGGMIEVPAAAVTADQFAQHLDFLSIGTNDLIQYTLAIDRVDDEVNYLYDPLHPSVLRLVKHTIEAGARHAKPVSLCGEMASDGRYTRLLLGLGLSIFSMDPATVPEVKQIVRNTDINNLAEPIDAIFNSTQSEQRIELLSQMNESLHDTSGLNLSA